MKKINFNVLGTFGTFCAGKGTNKPKSGTLRLLMLLVAVVAMSGNVWG